MEIKGEQKSPPEISALILQKLKRDAEAFLGTEVTDAVITVPAYFDDAQRQATNDAGMIAGLNVRRIINEPTAASLAYGMDKEQDQTILVFDLGGGTFDVSVLELGEGVFEVKSTNGDTHLGGDNWDKALVDWIVNEFRREKGRGPLQGPLGAPAAVRGSGEGQGGALFHAGDHHKPALHHHGRQRTAASGDDPHARQAGRTDPRSLDRVVGPTKQALKDANLSMGDLDQVVLVGGMTRMPAVQEKVRELTGKEPHKGINPDEVVALGAAIQGGVLAGEVKDVLLLDVTPL